MIIVMTIVIICYSFVNTNTITSSIMFSIIVKRKCAPKMIAVLLMLVLLLVLVSCLAVALRGSARRK